MSVPLVPTILRRAPRSIWLFCALAWGDSPLLFAENNDSKASRLGFKFEQAAHDAAVAADRARAAASEDPVPPGVVRLPRYAVTTKAVPPEDRMLTPKGRIALAERRYETDFYRAAIGPVEALASLINNPLGGWSPNAPEALALYEDEERLRRANEMSDLLGLADLADSVKRPADRAKDSKKAGK